MKKVLFLALVAVAVVFSSCKEDVYTQINPIAKACFAPGGNNTYYEYHDGRATGNDQNITVTISGYADTPYACDQKKTYRSAISYQLDGQSCLVQSNSCTADNTASIQIAIPHSEVLYLECDAEGNFVGNQNCITADYMESYNVNGVPYSKVHYFEVTRGTDLYHYYFAENVGLIYMYDDQQKVQLKLTGYEIH